MKIMIAVVLLALLRVAETYANPESDLLLAHKFSPILILTEETRDKWGDIRVIKPEPVEIVGANSAANLWFEVWTNSPSSSKSGEIESFHNWDPPLKLTKVNFPQNRFSFLPKEFTYTGRPPVSSGIASDLPPRVVPVPKLVPEP